MGAAVDRYRTLRLCANGGGYEAVPNREDRVDLPRLRDALAGSGVEVVDARVMLIARLEAETTISQRGRILIKTPDAALAQRTLARLLGVLDTVSASGSARSSRSG